MKKLVLLAAFVLFGISAIQAKNIWNGNQPYSFVQNGIQFTVFANGQFNFNPVPQSYPYGYYNDNYGNVNYNIPVDRDQYGRIYNVGGVYVDYDNLNRVFHIGNVLVDYSRFAPINANVQVVYNSGGPYIRGTAVINIGNGGRCNNYPPYGYPPCGRAYGYYYPTYRNCHPNNHWDNGNHYGWGNGHHYGRRD